MYQWSLARELVELGEFNSEFSDIERLRAEALEEWESERPSLLQRIISVFTPAPGPLIARSAIEAELIGAVRGVDGGSKLVG